MTLGVNNTRAIENQRYCRNGSSGGIVTSALVRFITSVNFSIAFEAIAGSICFIVAASDVARIQIFGYFLFEYAADVFGVGFVAKSASGMLIERVIFEPEDAHSLMMSCMAFQTICDADQVIADPGLTDVGGTGGLKVHPAGRIFAGESVRQIRPGDVVAYQSEEYLQLEKLFPSEIITRYGETIDGSRLDGVIVRG